METKIYTIEGKDAGKIDLPESLFGLPWNADLVHQVVMSMQANARHGNANTKHRGEVRGGGRKPWQQKGTGRARHGSSRSPIWKGGGVTHGPRHEKNYSVKINRSMAQKALLVAISRKYKDGEVIFVDSISMNAPKTKVASGMLMSLAKNFSGLNKSKNAAYIALPERNAHVLKSFANLGHVQAGALVDLNPVSVLAAKYLVIADPKSAIETLTKKAGGKAATVKTPKAPKVSKPKAVKEPKVKAEPKAKKPRATKKAA